MNHTGQCYFYHCLKSYIYKNYKHRRSAEVKGPNSNSWFSFFIVNGVSFYLQQVKLNWQSKNSEWNKQSARKCGKL